MVDTKDFFFCQASHFYLRCEARAGLVVAYSLDPKQFDADTLACSFLSDQFEIKIESLQLGFQWWLVIFRWLIESAHPIDNRLWNSIIDHRNVFLFLIKQEFKQKYLLNVWIHLNILIMYVWMVSYMQIKYQTIKIWQTILLRLGFSWLYLYWKFEFLISII